MSARTKILLGGIGARLLDFDPMGASTALRGTFTGGIHTLEAPANVVAPYGTTRLQNRRGNLEDTDTEEEGELELQLFGRGRQQIVVVEDAMDVCEEALLKWHTDQFGWFTVRGLVNRTTMPRYPKPADAEIIQIRAVWRYTWWPVYRSQYALAAGTPLP